MFDSDFNLGAPDGADLIAELGIRPGLVRELAEDARAIRCPERVAEFPERRFADLVPALPMDRDLHEAGPDEPLDPAPARRPAGRRWRRA